MITSDPQQRATRLDEVLDILRRIAPRRGPRPRPGPRPRGLDEMPDRLVWAFRRPPWPGACSPTSASSPARSRPRPSSTRACPGSTWRPEPSAEADAVAMGAGYAGLPLETTVVRDPHRRHALHLREPQELLPQGRASRLLRDPPDLHRAPPVGAHRVGGRTPRRGTARSATPTSRSSASSRRSGCGGSSTRSISVLKCVFHAVEDFEDMTPGLPRARAADPARAAGDAKRSRGLGRAFLEWLLDDNYIFMGTLRYRVQARRRGSTASTRPRPASSTTWPCCPWSSPGLMEQIESHLVPAAGRRPDHRHRLQQQRELPSTTWSRSTTS